MCDYSDAYIVVKVAITVEGANGANKTNEKLVIKRNNLFRPCTSTISNTFIDNAENVNIDMSMYNLFECNDN